MAQAVAEGCARPAHRQKSSVFPNLCPKTVAKKSGFKLKNAVLVDADAFGADVLSAYPPDVQDEATATAESAWGIQLSGDISVRIPLSNESREG
jgi:hypothetical protein